MEEARDWIRKTSIRSLVSSEQQKYIVGNLDKLPQPINHLIQYTKLKNCHLFFVRNSGSNNQTM